MASDAAAPSIDQVGFSRAMAVLLFVLLFVALALAVVLVGLSGQRRSRGGVNTRRGGRAYWYVGFAVILVVFGAGLPIAASFGNEDNAKEIPKSGISQLTASQEHGRELFAKYCRLCHTLQAANANASVGPNLDQLRPTKALVLNAIHNGRARGNGAMAKDLVVGEDAQDVASFVAAAVGQSGK
jgi:mono/diheme cytochrome c family protein